MGGGRIYPPKWLGSTTVSCRYLTGSYGFWIYLEEISLGEWHASRPPWWSVGSLSPPSPYDTLSTVPWLRVTISPSPYDTLSTVPWLQGHMVTTSVVHISLISKVAKTKNAWENSSCEWRQVDIMYVPAEALEGVSTGHLKGEEERRGSLLKLQKCLNPISSQLGQIQSQFNRSCSVHCLSWLYTCTHRFWACHHQSRV